MTGLPSDAARQRRAGLLALVVVLLAGCAAPGPITPASRSGASGSGEQAAPKRITAAIMGDPGVAISAAALNNPPGTDAMEQLVGAGLTVLDGSGTVRPRLAESVPNLNDGSWTLFPDGRMQTVWHLRDNGFWHDGVRVTAADAAFTAMLYREKVLPNPQSVAFQYVENVDLQDATALVVSWSKPFIDADRLLSDPILPEHLLRAPYEADRAGLMDSRYWREDYVGAGPYRVKAWVAGSHVALEAHEGYVLGKPSIQEIEVRFIPDSNTLMANVLSGSVELTLGRSLSLEQGIQTRDQWADGRMEITQSNWIAIFPQYLDPVPAVVADAQFRRALIHAIDRQEIVDSLLGGLVPVANSLINPDQPEFASVRPRITRYEYDPRQAGQIIESLGYLRAADGVFVDSTGQRLAVEIRQAGGDATRQKVLLSVGDSWQRIGVAFEPAFVSPQRQQDREYRATFPAFELVQNPNDHRALANLHSSQAPTPANGFAGNNRSRYRNPEFDALLDSYFGTIPPEARLKVLEEITDHLSSRLILMGLYYGAEVTMLGNRLRGVSASSVGATTQAWNAHEWQAQ